MKIKELQEEAAALGLKPPSQSELSKMIGRMWKEAQPDEKNYYISKAAQEKEAHKKAYPDYHYRPRRRTKNTEDATRPERGSLPSRVSSRTSLASAPYPNAAIATRPIGGEGSTAAYGSTPSTLAHPIRRRGRHAIQVCLLAR